MTLFSCTYVNYVKDKAILIIQSLESRKKKKILKFTNFSNKFNWRSRKTQQELYNSDKIE